jgi:hypothetical protein
MTAIKSCIVAYEDIVMWVEFAANPHKFMAAQAQCDRIMRCKKKPTADQLAAFKKNYEIHWRPDDSFEVLPCT